MRGVASKPWNLALVVGLACAAMGLNDALGQDKDKKKKEPPAKPKKVTVVDAQQAGPSFALQGEYVGDRGGKPVGLQVVARGGDKYDAVLYVGGLPGDGWDRKGKETFKGGSGVVGVRLEGPTGAVMLENGKALLTDKPGAAAGELKRTERTSPTLGQRPPEGAVVLFDGTSADAWQGGTMTADKLLNVGVRSKQTFGAFTLHMEFRTPYMPDSSGQARGNSGCYLQDRYELQILDSFGLEGVDNECGGFYKVKRPDENMCLPPLAWQTYDIDFTPAAFDSTGKKLKTARTTVRHNGVVIHNDLELPNSTAGGKPESASGGPIQLQNHGNPVHFRNIWLVEKK